MSWRRDCRHNNYYQMSGPRRGCAHGLRVAILIAILVTIGMSMGGRHEVSYAAGGRMRMHAFGAQSYMNGLRVESGQTLTGDIVVYSGNAMVEKNGTIKGSLVVYGGDATVRNDGEITGDLTVWAGDVRIDGRVGGNVSALAGDVKMGDQAYVGGDVSTLSGEIDRSDSATIAGNVVRAPKMDFASKLFEPAAPGAPAAPVAPAAPGAAHVVAGSLIGGFFGLLARLFLAFFLTLLATVVTMVVYTMRPTTIDRVQKEMRANLPRSFALGITVTVALWLLMMLLGIAFCLKIFSIVPALLLFALTAVGWTVMGRTLGQRLLPSVHTAERRPVMEVALGALILSGTFAVVAALFGGHLNILVGLAALVVAAPGVGAFVEPWVDRYRNRGTRNYSTPGASGTPPAPSAPAAPSARPVAPAPDKVEIVPVVAAPVVPPIVAAAPPPPVAQGEPDVDLSAVETPAVGLSVDDDTFLTQPLTAVEPPQAATESSDETAFTLEPEAKAHAADESFAFELPESQAPAAADAGVSIQDLVSASDADVAAAAAAAAAKTQAAQQAAGEPPAGADFTRIAGIGRSADRKLRAAGILTYAQLAAAPVEMIAAILGIRVEEVIEDEIQKQAHALVP